MRVSKKIFFAGMLFATANSFAQSNFSFIPKNPQAGQTITITYTPPEEMATAKAPLAAAVYSQGIKEQDATDLDLKRIGNTYTATVQTDIADNFLYFSFSANKVYDKNNNDGYWIQLYDGDQLKKGANIRLAEFYSGGSRMVGIEETNWKKSLEAMEAAFEAHPDLRNENLRMYLQIASQENKEEAPALVQKEIESHLKEGLKDEADYTLLQSLYSIAKLPSQATFINNLKREKFPDGKWTINETVQHYMREKDLSKKSSMLKEILNNIKTNPDWENMEGNIPFFKSNLINTYIAEKDFAGMKSAIQQLDIQDKDLASSYNSYAWKAQEKNENLKQAETFSKIATDWARSEWKNPQEKKPSYLTEKGWKKNRERIYSTYADTYAMVEYKLGNYKNGLSYTQEAAIKLLNGESADQNNTYALLAEKVLPARKYIPQLEKFVKEGKATSKIKDILKEAYVKRNGEMGYDTYMAKLEEESHKKMLEELRKKIIDEEVKEFALLDLEGNKVSSADLKNKIVVVDFWATWCGPCKASFPGMQKMVTKYKSDPGVKFVFIDTWENVDNKEKEAGDFIKKNNYDFHVLMDNDNKVVEQFKVSGIPTKFVLDKKGYIRFKSVGFGGSTDNLISELSAMIDMVKTE